MTRKYPIIKASSMPGTGNEFYSYLLKNVNIPAKMAHEMWYAGVKEQFDQPDLYPLRGALPVGSSLKLINNETGETYIHTFKGNENHVFVKDLAPSARNFLNIPENAREKDKVYNYNFHENYYDLREEIKTSNATITLSLAKAISNFLCIKIGSSYSEENIVEMITTAINDLSSIEMKHIFNSNHNMWAALTYANSGMLPDVEKEFYNQTDVDFIAKDLDTVLPSMLYAVAVLGVDPVVLSQKVSYPVWGINEAAQELQKYMAINQVAEKDLAVNA